MRGNALGFSNDKSPVGRSRQTAPNDELVGLELDGPIGRAKGTVCTNGALCCSALGVFLAIAGIGIGAWYIVAVT